MPDAAKDMMEAIEHRVHAEDRPRVKADMAELVVTRIAGHQEFRVVWRDGSVHVLAGACAVHHDPGGEEVELVGFFKDITDERRAQQQIARLEDIRDTAEEEAGMASWEYDAATHVTTWTRGTERLFDIAGGEHAGDLLALLEARVHPDDASAALAAFGAALSRGDALSVEYRVVHRDGSEHVLTSLARSRLDDTGRLLVVTGYHRDVTQERRARAEMETLRTMRDEAERVAGMASWSIDLEHGDRHVVTRHASGLRRRRHRGRGRCGERRTHLRGHRRPRAPRGPRRHEQTHRRGSRDRRVPAE